MKKYSSTPALTRCVRRVQDVDVKLVDNTRMRTNANKRRTPTSLYLSR